MSDNLCLTVGMQCTLTTKGRNLRFTFVGKYALIYSFISANAFLIYREVVRFFSLFKVWLRTWMCFIFVCWMTLTLYYRDSFSNAFQSLSIYIYVCPYCRLQWVWLRLSGPLLHFAEIHSAIILSKMLLLCCSSSQAWPGRSQSPAIPTPMRLWPCGTGPQMSCWDPRITPPAWTCGGYS